MLLNGRGGVLQGAWGSKSRKRRHNCMSSRETYSYNGIRGEGRRIATGGKLGRC